MLWDIQYLIDRNGNGYAIEAIMSVNTIVGFCNEMLMFANYVYN